MMSTISKCFIFVLIMILFQLQTLQNNMHTHMQMHARTHMQTHTYTQHAEWTYIHGASTEWVIWGSFSGGTHGLILIWASLMMTTSARHSSENFEHHCTVSEIWQKESIYIYVYICIYMYIQWNPSRTTTLIYDHPLFTTVFSLTECLRCINVPSPTTTRKTRPTTMAIWILPLTNDHPIGGQDIC